MLQPPIIKLLKGFCTISFGETRENVKAIFGEPEEMQTLTDDILNTSSLVYHYWDLGFSLFFDNNKEAFVLLLSICHVLLHLMFHSKNMHHQFGFHASKVTKSILCILTNEMLTLFACCNLLFLLFKHQNSAFQHKITRRAFYSITSF